MPALLNWLLRLLPTNPICMRLVQGGSRQLRHFSIRAGYLAVMVLVLLFVLLGQVSGSSPSLRELAGAGANMFQLVSYLQVILICLLTPIFMAGAIAQEANPRTWDILLTTPLNNLQVVLGNLFGRLFFVVALLFSSLPLFVMTQYFGGVPGESIFWSYLIAGASALLVAAVAVTLSVTRTAGRRAVMIFYFGVIAFLAITYGGDRITGEAVGVGTARNVSFFTALNPFLSLRVLLESNNYIPRDFSGEDVSWLTAVWLGRPITAFLWFCVGTSVILITLSTLRVRVIGTKMSANPWYRRLMGLAPRGATERPARHVGRNPITWRERTARGKSVGAIAGRWGFVALGLAAIGTMIALHRTGGMSTPNFQLAVVATIVGEIVIIVLVALNQSATAVSREREDGSLDIILTTPIQPGPYLRGKHQGLLQFLVPMLLVPIGSMAILSLYAMTNAFGNPSIATVTVQNPNLATNFPPLPLVLPEGAVALGIMLVPFVAFCVMVGLQWSIKSKGTIGSVIAAVGVVLAVVGVLSLCGQVGGSSMSLVGALLVPASPVNLAFAVVVPHAGIPSALESGLTTARVTLIIGSIASGGIYAALSYGMHTTMTRTFMMTVRRLAGTG